MNSTNTKPIRILHCLASLDRGGSETFVMNVYRNIDRSQIQFDFLYSFDGVYRKEIESLGGQIFQIPFITQCGPFAYRRHAMHFFKKHPEYQIVHSHMDKFNGLIMECAKAANIPTRIAHSHSIRNEGGLLFQIVKNYYGRKILPNCTHKFACSKDAAQWLFPNNYDDAIIVKNGIDLNKYTNVDRRNSSLFTICNIGRFVEVKNHSFLIDIFQELYTLNPNSRLILAGSGTLMNTIQDKVHRFGLTPYVTFLGDCSTIPELLSTVDVLCVPSQFEGLGITIIEAQAAGVPCIVSDQIPTEVNLTGEVTFLSLKESAKHWAIELLKYQHRSKYEHQKEIRDHGYDITSTANQLQSFYKSNN